MNLLELEGNVGRDIKLIQGKQTAFCSFSLACNFEGDVDINGNQQTTWVSFKAFGEVAEECARATKGDRLYVRFKPKNSKTGLKNEKGYDIYSTDLIVQEAMIKKRSGVSNEVPQAPVYQDSNSFEDFGPELDIDADDLPF